MEKLYFGKYKDDIVMTEYNESYERADSDPRWHGNFYGLAYKNSYNNSYIVVNNRNEYLHIG